MSAKPSFFARRSLIILMVVFFLVPFAMRGARLAIQGMKNDVKDWLPKEFRETAELEWFRDHFVSEQFVVVSWDGCTGQSDPRYDLFLAKLQPEIPPSERPQPAEQGNSTRSSAEETAAGDDPEGDTGDEEDGSIENPTHYFHRKPFIGDELGLYLTSADHYNWGGKKEKWLRGKATTTPGDRDEAWYYITPEGDLFRWNAVDSPIAGLLRSMTRAINGPSVEGELVATFDHQDGAWYHEQPRRLRAQLFKSMTAGPDVLESLVNDDSGELSRLDDPEAEAYARLEGTLFGPPALREVVEVVKDPMTGEEREVRRTEIDPEKPRQTCIVLTLSDAAKQNLHLVVGRGLLGKPRGLLYELAEECNIAPKDRSGEGLWLGGPPVDNVAIDEEGTITLVRLVGLCAVVGIGLSLICFRSITATIMVFFIGGISAVMSIAFVWWLGGSMDAILMSMPALVYVLGLMGATHIINYYHEAVTEHGYPGASERAISHAWKPAIFCNVTTAIGLLSLMTSELVPIQKFGWYSAIGVMATLAVLFTYLPAALQVWPQKPRQKTVQAGEASLIDQFLGGLWHRLGSWIIRHHALVAVASFAVIGLFSCGIYYMRTSVNMLKMFHSEAKIIRDYTTLEQKLGPLVPMEIIVKVPKTSQRPSIQELATLQDRSPQEEQVQMPFLERMELADRVRRVIMDEFGPRHRKVVGNATSAATFVRPLPDSSGDSINWTYRNTTSSRLEAHRSDFLHSDYLRIDQKDGSELWRITIRIPATQGIGDGLKGVDYGQFVEELKSAVEPVVNAHREREQVLRTLVGALKPADGAGEPNEPPLTRVANAKVLVLGMPANAMRKPNDAADGDSAETAADAKRGADIDQRQIFARTLAELLDKSRVKLSLHSTEKDDQSHDWAKIAAEQDCVVLVNDAGYDVNLIRQHAKRFVDAREHQFDPVRDNRADMIAGSPSAIYTGVVPIVYKAQRSLLESLISSSLWSFLTITPLMMFVSRSFSGGAVAMLPNVMPVVMVFGGMGWLGIPVDVGSMMTASIALGVAVDDTIHYLNWFREELDRTGDRKQAILAAYKHCATPTFQAAIISGIGLSVFALSTFTPTQRFGILMLTILWMGVVAELIFFPAILAGPLGLVFKPRKNRPAMASGGEPADAIEVQEPQDELIVEGAHGISASRGAAAATPHTKDRHLRLVREDGRHAGDA
jgi:predicted RND superfamily exporter protein